MQGVAISDLGITASEVGGVTSVLVAATLHMGISTLQPGIATSRLGVTPRQAPFKILLSVIVRSGHRPNLFLCAIRLCAVRLRSESA